MSSDIREKLSKEEIAENIAQLLLPHMREVIMSSTRTCLTCDNFKEHKGELCGLVNQRPPARVIAFGCPSYINEIPF